MIRIVSFFIFLVCFSTIRDIPKALSTKDSTITFSSESFLKIKGKTNVSTFECEFNMNVLSDSINIGYNDFDGLLKFNRAKLILPNGHFNCGGNSINNDFNKLLNTEEFPEINIYLKEIINSAEDKNQVEATVEIVICNILKTYTIPIDINQKDYLMINGTLPIDINDFNLTAPKKVLGMVKVSPIIEIIFSLKVIYS